MPTPSIIREAVPREKCNTAAAELQRTLSIREQGSYAEYRLTPTCDWSSRDGEGDGGSPTVGGVVHAREGGVSNRRTRNGEGDDGCLAVGNGRGERNGEISL
jgi:hypothetical protein